MSTSDVFTFPGLWPYIERAAAGRILPFLGRGRGLWHYSQVQDSLGQLPGLDADARRQSLAHVEAVRDSLAAALAGIDLAVEESLRALGDAAEGATTGLDPAESSGTTPLRAAGPRRRRG